VRPEVLDAMRPVLTERFGNPSSLHQWGREARALRESARERVAAALGAQRREIVFTSGGTEADNLAVLGAVRAAGSVASRVIVSALEHKAVLAAATRAAEEGAQLVVAAVDRQGTIDLGALEQALPKTAAGPKRAFCAVMWGNNEVGSVQPVAQVADLCGAVGAQFHTDAVQALGKVRVRVDEIGCTTMAVSGHKIGAPKGVGALFVRQGIRLEPLIHGGGQEFGLRPGTENLASIVGFALAVELAVRELTEESARLRMLRDRLQRELCERIPEAVVNGAGAERLPHILNLSIPDVDQEALLVSLDLEGCAVSSGSACQSGSVEPSHVLVAMGRAVENEASIRLSVGRTTSAEDIAELVQRLPPVVQRLRRHGPAAGVA
jgi:cysteine desulfurase